MNIASMSAYMAIWSSRNLTTNPVRFVSRSGPVRRMLLRETPLKMLEAFSTRRIFPGLFWHSLLGDEANTIFLSCCSGLVYFDDETFLKIRVDCFLVHGFHGEVSS